MADSQAFPEGMTKEEFDLLIDDYGDAIDALERWPNMRTYIWDYGLTRDDLWKDQEPRLTEAAVLDWHWTRHNDLVQTRPHGPLDQTLVQQNLSGRRDVINDLIRGGFVQVLQDLHTAGRWHPCSYSIWGYTPFYRAVTHRGVAIGTVAPLDQIIQYIALHAHGNERFLRSPGSLESVTGSPDPNNHWDIALQENQYTIFERWLKSISMPPHIPVPNMPALNSIVLQAASQEQLCRRITRAIAETLLNSHNINLALHQPLNNIGTVWHLAVDNPNADFLDFLYPYIPNEIDTMLGMPHTPLRRTLNNGAAYLAHFRKLLDFGADPETLYWDFFTLTHRKVSDPWYKALKPHIRHQPHNRVIRPRGTVLHCVVEGLPNEFQNIAATVPAGRRAGARRNAVQKTTRLLKDLRAGNRRGVPQVNETNNNGRTARDRALQLRLLALYDSDAWL